jgi:hypothetical protein
MLFSLADKVPNADEVKSFLLRGDQHILVRPTGRKPAVVVFSNLSRRGKLVTYSVYNAKGNDVAVGVMTPDKPVVLDTQASEYYHLIINAGQASYHVEVKDAIWALNGKFTSRGLHLLGKASPVYFEVPEGIGSFRLQLGATPPGETAVATLYEQTDGRRHTSTAQQSPWIVRRLLSVRKIWASGSS